MFTRPKITNVDIYESDGRPATQDSFRTQGLPLHLTKRFAIVAVLTLCVAVAAAPVSADLGPCTTAAPTTSDVHLLVSDVDRAARWYRDNVGLTEQRRWVEQTFGGATLISMQRGAAGVTLVDSQGAPTAKFHDPQMVCLVLDGPPAPVTGTKPLFLADPDGTSVELPVTRSPDIIAFEGVRH